VCGVCGGVAGTALTRNLAASAAAQYMSRYNGNNERRREPTIQREPLVTPSTHMLTLCPRPAERHVRRQQPGARARRRDKEPRRTTKRSVALFRVRPQHSRRRRPLITPPCCQQDNRYAVPQTEQQTRCVKPTRSAVNHVRSPRVSAQRRTNQRLRAGLMVQRHASRNEQKARLPRLSRSQMFPNRR